MTHESYLPLGVPWCFKRDDDGCYLPLFSLHTFEPVGSHTSINVTGIFEIVPTQGADKCLLQLETGKIRYKLDGFPASNSVGFLLDADTQVILLGFKFGRSIWIARVSGNVKIQYQLGR